MSMFIHNCIPTSQLYSHTVGSDHHSESVIPLHLTYLCTHRLFCCHHSLSEDRPITSERITRLFLSLGSTEEKDALFEPYLHIYPHSSALGLSPKRLQSFCSYNSCALSFFILDSD